MGRPSKITPEIQAFILERRRKGLSHRAIVEELAGRGTSVSLGTVQRAAPARRRRDPVSEPPRPASTLAQDALPPPSTSDGPSDDLETLLKASLADLNKAVAAAASDENQGARVAAHRVIAQIGTLLEKMRPPPIVNPNEAPDMVAAAAEARELFHAGLERVLSRTS